MVKEQEFLEKKASYCLGLAKKLGATESSVIVNNSVSETVNFRNKKLDESNRSDDLGISITTYIGKKKSSISSSNLLDDNLNILIEKCVETTKNTPEDEFNSLPDKDLHFKGLKDLDLYDETHLSNEDKINYIKEAEDVEVKPQSRLITPQQEIGDVNVTSPNINITPPTTQEQPVQAASLPTSPSEGITSLNKGEQFEGLFPTDNLGRMIANRRS